MSQQDLRYAIAVTVDQTAQVKQLYEMLRAVQDLAERGVGGQGFTIAVRADSLNAIAKSVAEAVEKGVGEGLGRPPKPSAAVGGGSRAAGPGAPSGSSTTLEAAITELTRELQRARTIPPTGGEAPGGGRRRKPLSPLMRAKSEDLLAEVQDFQSSPQQDFSRYINKTLEKYLRTVPRSVAAKLRKIQDDLDQQVEGAAEKWTQHLSPKAVQAALEARLGRGSAPPASRGYSGGATSPGAVHLSVNSAELSAALKEGAGWLERGIRDAMGAATDQLVKALRQVRLSGGGGGQRADLNEEQQAEIERSLGGRVSSRHLDIVQGEAQVAEAAYRTAKRAHDKLVQDYEDLRQRMAEAAAGRAELRLNTDEVKRLEAGPSAIQASSALLTQLSNTHQETAATLARLRAPGVGKFSVMQEEAFKERVRVDPSGHSSYALLRAARTRGTMSTNQQILFDAAQDMGLVAIPDRLGGAFENRRAAGHLFKRERESQALRENIERERAGLKDEPDPEKRDVAEKRIARMRQELGERENESFRIAMAEANAVIKASLAQYMRKVLPTMLERGEIDEGEFKRRSGAAQAGERALADLREVSPDTMREAILIPQALAQYIRDMTAKYAQALRDMATAAGPEQTAEARKAVDTLRQEMKQVDALSLLAGKDFADDPVEAQKQAEARLVRLLPQMNDINSFKTAYEATIPRRKPGLPQFHPQLEYDIPQMLDPASSQSYHLTMAQRRAQLANFVEQGGRFAPQSEERRASAEAEMSALMNTVFELRKRGAKSGEIEYAEQLVESRRKELEFGGQYYYPDAIGKDRNIIDGVLRSNQERVRIAQGGAGSGVAGPTLSPGDVGRVIAGDSKEAATLTGALSGVEAALARISKTLNELTSASFAPMIEHFDNFTKSLLPLADVVARINKGFSASQLAALKALGPVFTAQERARGRENVLNTEADRKTDVIAADKDRYLAKRAADERLKTTENWSRSLSRIAELDKQDDFDQGFVARRTRSKNLTERVRKEQRVEAQKRIEELRTDGAAKRQYIREEFGEYRKLRREMEALQRERERYAASEIPWNTTVPPQAPEVTQELLSGAFNKATRTQLSMLELNALLKSRAGAGLSTATTSANIASAAAKFDAQTGQLAGYVLQSPQGYFGDQDGQARGISSRLLDAQTRRGDLSRAIGAVGNEQATFKNLQAQLRFLDNIKGSEERRKKLADEITASVQRQRAAYDVLVAKGIISSSDIGNVNKLRDAFDAVGSEVRELQQGLIASTSAQMKLTKEGGGFWQQFTDKLNSLKHYVLAGGVVYTVANQLRTVLRESVAVEAELLRIQGVFESRSPAEASAVGRGLYGAASDYGVPLTQSVQAAKFFAQTGASPQETVQLTRASLAATVGAGMDPQRASDFLIAVRNISGGRVAPSDINDRISRVEARYAVSAQDLATGIQRVGSLIYQLQPQQLGQTDAFDNLIGMMSAVIERTRVSGEQASTAIKFLLTRLTSPRVGKALQERYGIELAGRTPDELRPATDILADISQKYLDLTSEGKTVQAQDLLVTFAGARQAGIAAALLTDFHKALDVAATSATAYGDTQIRVAAQLQSLESQFARFQTAMVGFASNLIKNTGAGAVVGGALRAGTGALQLVSSPAGALGAAGALGLAGAAGSGLLSVAGRRLSSSTVTTAFGAPLALGTSAVSGSGAIAKVFSVLNRVGLILAPLTTGAAIFGVIGAASVLTSLFRRFRETRDIQSGAAFDRKTFEESEFFTTYQGTANRFGMSANELRTQAEVTARTLVEDLTKQYGANVLSGAEANPQLYWDASKRLVEAFDKAIPGFAALGDLPERMTTAFSILRETGRFDNAVAETASAEFGKDLATVMTKLDENLGALGKALSDPPKTSRLLNLDRSAGAYDTREALGGEAVTNALDNLFRINGTSWGRLSSLLPASVDPRVTGYNSAQTVAALDEYAKRDLLTSPLAVSQLRNAEDLLRREKKSKEAVITAEERLTRALELMADKSDVARAQLEDQNRRLVNQEALARDILRLFERDGNLGTGNRLTQAALDQGQVVTSDTPGQAFVAALRQVLTTVQEQAKRGFDSQLGARVSGVAQRDIGLLLKALTPGTSRPEQLASLYDRQGASNRVRERLLDPLLTFSTTLAEIAGQLEASRRFGLDFDPIAARSQAAQQLVSSTAAQPARLLGELARSQLQFLLSSGQIDTEAAARTLGALEEDPGVVSAAIARFTSDPALKENQQQQRQRMLAQIKGLQEQLGVIQNTGLGSFLDLAGSSGDASMREQAAGLRETFRSLEEASHTLEPGSLEVFNQFTGKFKEWYDAVIKLATGFVSEDTRRRDALFSLESTFGFNQANLRRYSEGREVDEQITLRALQRDPRFQAAALQQQLGSLGARRADAEEAARLQRERDIAVALTEDPSGLNSNTQKAIIRADQAYQTAVADGLATETAARRQLVAGLHEEMLARDRTNAFALVQNVTSPLRNFLLSTQGSFRENMGRLVEGVAESFRTRLVDVFMHRLFSETGVLGPQLASVFDNGALQTKTSIEQGFQNGVAQLSAVLNGTTPTPGGETGGDVDGGSGGAGKIRDGWKGVLDAALPLGGIYGGTLLGNAVGGKQNSYASDGSAIGSALGSLTPLGPVGGLAGGLLGGLFGGLFGKGPEEVQQLSVLERIERNTREQIAALENQTQLLTLDSRFLNVPAGFTVPSFRPFGVSGTTNITATITVNASPQQDERQVAQLVVRELQAQLGTRGGSFDLRVG